MTSRYEDVVDAHPETFDWAFQEPGTDQLPWSNFATWLETGEGVYWICDKAGSGKPTLMKYILDDPRTHQYLASWALNAPPKDELAPLCIATFFFWDSGSADQKSQTGLLRAILFQVLQQHSDLIPVVLPEIWAKVYSKSLDVSSPVHISWPLRPLMMALRSLLHQTSISLRLCLITDGLNEFDGDHDEPTHLFKEIIDSGLGHVKVCLSSRPWVVFENNFETYPNLRLQNLTYGDIDQYVRDRFRRSDAFRKLVAREPKSSRSLMREVVKKAEGVFLWVELWSILY